MTRFLDLVFTAPPSMDAPIFIGIQDDSGGDMIIGSWLSPDNDTPFWRLRLPVHELVLQLVAPGLQIPPPATQAIATQLQAERSQNSGITARQALKEKIASAKRKDQGSSAATPPEREFENDGRERCPECNKRADRLSPCRMCGDDKCGECIPNPQTAVCVVCDALTASPDEGGFDPSARPEDPRLARARATADASEPDEFGARIFDNTFRGRAGADTDRDED